MMIISLDVRSRGNLFVGFQRLQKGSFQRELQRVGGCHLFTYLFFESLQGTFHLSSVLQETLRFNGTNKPLCGHVDSFSHSDF